MGESLRIDNQVQSWIVAGERKAHGGGWVYVYINGENIESEGCDVRN